LEPSPAPSDRPRAISPAVAKMLTAAYVLLTGLAGWAFIYPSALDEPVPAMLWSGVVLHPLAWVAVVLAFAADLRLARDRASSGKGIRIGSVSFFHGPLVVTVYAVAAVLGVLTAFV